MAPYIPELEEGDNLEEFVETVVQPPTDYDTESKEVVHELVKYLHQLPDYSIKQIIKGGSLGKNTHLENSADIDLILFFNGYDSISELRQCKGEILDDIEDYLNETPDWITHIECRKRTKFHVSFKMELCFACRPFVVDILPAIDIVEDNDGDLDAVYRLMEQESSTTRKHYSVCFAMVQKQLLQDQSDDVIKLIQLLKYCNTELDLGLKSYCCEVLTLFVVWKYYKKKTLIFNAAFRKILNLLRRYETLHIVLPYNYNKHQCFQFSEHKTPYVIDPVNPFSNTAYIKPWKMKRLMRWAEKTLECFYE